MQNLLHKYYKKILLSTSTNLRGVTISDSPVIALYISILLRITGLNKRDLNAMFRCIHAKIWANTTVIPQKIIEILSRDFYDVNERKFL